MFPHPTSWRFILILSSHLRLRLPSGPIPSGLPHLYTPLLFPPTCHTRPAHLVLDLITRIISGEEYVRTIYNLHLRICMYIYILLWPCITQKNVIYMYIYMCICVYIYIYIVGIATAYGLDGPRNESQWRRDFPHLSRPTLRPTQPPVQWVPGISRGKMRPGRDADPSPPSSAEVKNKVELYLYSP